MKKVIIKIVMGIFMCIVALRMNSVAEMEVHAEVKPEYMQDVPLDGAHFPDEQFRKKLKISVDENKDGILSREEREKIYYLDLYSYTNTVSKTWYQDMEYMRLGYNNEDYEVWDKTKCALLLNFSYNEEDPQRSLADPAINVRGIEYFFNLQEVMIDKYELVSGSLKIMQI